MREGSKLSFESKYVLGYTGIDETDLTAVM